MDKKKKEPQKPESPLFSKKVSRRTLLGGAATAAVALVQTSVGKAVQVGVPLSEVLAEDPTKVQGLPASPVGSRSPFEKPVRQDKGHTRFGLLWRWNGAETEIMSRAIDETGYTQPSRAELIAARGVGAVPYHLNPITAWRLKPDGQVVYRPEAWK